MAKINKVYPAFFNGVSQQSPELVLDNQCKEMVNCIPSIVNGINKRPPVTYVTSKDFTTYPEMQNAVVFHTYDRGEDDEEYILVKTTSATDPVQIFNKAGDQQVVEYNADNATAIKAYLALNNLKGLTVQDRTWVYSKNATVSVDTSETYPLQPDYTRVAYFWLKRGSGDRYNPFNYAVYLNNTTYAVDPDKPDNSTSDPATGAEDSDVAAQLLADKINASVAVAYSGEISLSQSLAYKEFSIYIGAGKTGVTGTFPATVDVSTEYYDSATGYFSFFARVASYDPFGSTLVEEFTINEANAAGFTAEVRGSILKIYKDDGSDFTFSSWDSWGNQASEGWKGEVNKISDLPKDMPFHDVYVKILGDEGNTFTDYFVHWSGSSWVETLDPAANRGKLTNMPVKLDRTSLVNGVATFTFDLVDWSQPIVGNEDNNPDPSFVGRRIQDLFFYKNRLGIASEDSVTLTETANYTNFFATTVVDIIDTDVIDITISTNQASKIYYAKPFNNSLYIFTKYAQYELISEGIFSPSTVSISNTTNYPMATDVEPLVVNDSLYFISTTNNQQQLREYIKADNLSVKGIDLNVSTPTYLKEPITKLIADGVLGYVLCCTNTNIVYLYSFKEDGTQRIQSAWSKWELFENLAEYGVSLNAFYTAIAQIVVGSATGATSPLHQFLTTPAAGDTYARGDITNDGSLGIGDMISILRHITGIEYNSKIDAISAEWFALYTSDPVTYNQAIYSTNIKPESFEYNVIGSTLLITFKGLEDYRYHQLELDYKYSDKLIDESIDGGVVTTYPYTSSVLLPDYYPKLGDVRTPLNKMLIKRVKVQGEGTFNASVYRKDYNKTYLKSKDYSMKDLDLNVASKVGNVDITIYDDSTDNFKITSVVVEGLFNTTSREMR